MRQDNVRNCLRDSGALYLRMSIKLDFLQLMLVVCSFFIKGQDLRETLARLSFTLSRPYVRQ